MIVSWMNEVTAKSKIVLNIDLRVSYNSQNQCAILETESISYK